MTVRPRTNYVLDLALLILLIVVMVSGVLLWVVYPQGGSGGSAGGRGQGRGRSGVEQEAEHSAPVEAVAPSARYTLLSLDRGEMREIHNWSGLGMGALMLVHLLFHLKWLLCQTRQMFRRGHRRPRSATIVQESVGR